MARWNSAGSTSTGAHDGLLRWATDFSEAEPERDHGVVPESVIVRRASFAAVALVAITTVVALVVPFREERSSGAADETQILAPPAPSPTVVEPDRPRFAVLPPTCDGLYGSDMLEEFAERGLEPNHVWTGVREATAGSADPELVEMLRREMSLDCYWLDETGGTEAAVLTVASEPGPEVVQAVQARLDALGFARQNDLGGVRYFIEERRGGEAMGESHFLRDGVWLATNWYGFGPWGYTRHLAENVFS